MTIARIGSEFVVNFTPFGAQSESAATALPDGRFIVSWTDPSVTPNDTSGTAVRARIFNADGSESLSEFLVNTSTFSDQRDSNVSALADGRFIVTWTDQGGDTSGYAVRARIFNADGTQSVPEFLLNSSTANDQYQSSVTVLADGRFVVTWTDFSATVGDTSASAVRARIFNADGTQSVPEFLVNTTTSDSQTESSVTALADGRFLVTWTDLSATGSDTSGYAVRARIFNADGTQSVPEFLVNTSTFGYQYASAVAALADGRFVVTWTDGSGTGGDPDYGIRARIFNADGTQSAPEFLVNSTTPNYQTENSVTALADGRFVVTWTDYSASGGDTSLRAVRACIFNADGTQSVPEFLVNTTTVADQYDSSVTAMTDGRFVVSWTDLSGTGFDDNMGAAIRSQVFDPTIYDGTSAGETVTGGAFADRYNGYGGSDTISGRGGDDILNGGDGDDTLNGDDGNDKLDGGNNGDTLNGGAGNDLLYGRAGTDILTGGDGGDQLWGGLGVDIHTGGDDAGIDYARYDDANYGNLTIRLDGGANVGAVAVGDTYTGIEGLVGGLGNDTIHGNGSNNYLFGGGGADLIYGKDGNDYLSGDAGADNLWGGLGADQHIGGNDASIDYARYDDANYGNLTIRLDFSNFNAGAAAVGDTYSGIEGLVGGLGADIVVGNASANYLFGGGNNDYIDGRAGNDYMNGGAGADRFVFATALGAGNIDTIADFTTATDDIVLNAAIFAAVGATLTADEFRVGAAVDANDFILYNSATGALTYDSNGVTAGGAVQFATLATGLALTFDDFIVA